MAARILLFSVAMAVASIAIAQPTWRFHLAFEDGTGAKDTIWFVFDTTATNGAGMVDTQLGEGAVDMDLNVFNVWIFNQLLDSTKTGAVPYLGYFPQISAEIQAFNYTYPITLRWDTALFRLPWLPEPGFPYDGGTMDSDFFFFEGSNDFWGHSFIMGWTDSVVVDPQFGTYPFPLLVNLGLGSTVDIPEEHGQSAFRPFPNPGWEELTVRDGQMIEVVQVWAMDGRLCKVQGGNGRMVELEVPELTPGIYLLRIRRADGTWRQERWVKAAAH